MRQVFQSQSFGEVGSLAKLELLDGNDEEVTLEKIRAVEVGYSAILGRKLFLTADYHRSAIRDFVRSGVPLVGTALGRANGTRTRWLTGRWDHDYRNERLGRSATPDSDHNSRSQPSS